MSNLQCFPRTHRLASHRQHKMTIDMVWHDGIAGILLCATLYFSHTCDSNTQGGQWLIIMEVCREEILPTCRNALNIKLPKINAGILLIISCRYLLQPHIRSQPYISDEVEEYCHMSCCGWLGMMCPQLRNPHHQNHDWVTSGFTRSLDLTVTDLAIFRLKSWTKYPSIFHTATIGRRHFSCLCLWTFPHLLCCFHFEGTVVRVLLLIPASTYKNFWAWCDRRGWAMQRNLGTWGKFLVHNLSLRAVPAMATLSATASLTLSSKSFANALPRRKSWTESFIQSAVSLLVSVCLSHSPVIPLRPSMFSFSRRLSWLTCKLGWWSTRKWIYDVLKGFWGCIWQGVHVRMRFNTLPLVSLADMANIKSFKAIVASRFGQICCSWVTRLSSFS